MMKPNMALFLMRHSKTPTTPIVSSNQVDFLCERQTVTPPFPGLYHVGSSVKFFGETQRFFMECEPGCMNHTYAKEEG